MYVCKTRAEIFAQYFWWTLSCLGVFQHCLERLTCLSNRKQSQGKKQMIKIVMSD